MHGVPAIIAWDICRGRKLFTSVGYRNSSNLHRSVIRDTRRLIPGCPFRLYGGVEGCLGTFFAAGRGAVGADVGATFGVGGGAAFALAEVAVDHISRGSTASANASTWTSFMCVPHCGRCPSRRFDLLYSSMIFMSFAINGSGRIIPF